VPTGEADRPLDTRSSVITIYKVKDDPLRDAIEEAFVVERGGWAGERVQRVTERLQRDVPEAQRLETLVLWMDDHNAFTTQGRTIYISRRLLERLPDDDAAAFVIAHELAHHRLGHVPALPASWLGIARLLLVRLETAWVATPARETDADLLAIEMCIDAGYDPERCIVALQHLVNVSLDYGDVDGVLGPEEQTSARSHPALTARIRAVRAHVAVARRGVRQLLDVTRRREQRWRRKALVGVGAGAAAVCALVILRRPPRGLM
jgi:Zn-dependent protease with chaperone function